MRAISRWEWGILQARCFHLQPGFVHFRGAPKIFLALLFAAKSAPRPPLFKRQFLFSWFGLTRHASPILRTCEGAEGVPKQKISLQEFIASLSRTRTKQAQPYRGLDPPIN